MTWTEVDLPPTPSTGAGSAADLGCELEVQKNGTVHVIYNTLRCLASCNNEQQFYSQSTDGGLTWSAPVLVRDFNITGFSAAGNECPNAQNARCVGPFGAIAVDNTGGPCDGSLYVAFTDFASPTGHANQADVWLTRSTNNGVTWGAPVKINDNGLIDRTQFHPFVQVDPFTGYPVVGWHDARNDPRAGKAYMAWTDSRHYFPSFLNNQRENLGFTVVDFTGPSALSGPSPGRPAGVNNTWTISGGTPTQANFLIYGLTPGSVAVPGCPGVTVGIQDINILASGPADSNGDFTFSLFIPGSLTGLTVLFQSVELSTCDVSSLITHTF